MPFIRKSATSSLLSTSWWLHSIEAPRLNRRSLVENWPTGLVLNRCVSSLAFMLTLIERLGLRQIAARILHELALGVRAAETVGLALDRGIYGAIRLHVLVVGETPGTHVSELAGRGISRTGKADDDDTGYEILFHFGRSFRFGRPPVS